VVNLEALRKGLDKLGMQGWELVAVTGSSPLSLYYFKRPRPAK
jgi:hypothetical protein